MAKKGVRGLFGRVLLGANIVTSLLMFLTGYSYLVNPLKCSIASTMGLFFPFFLALNIAFLVFWLFYKWKKAYVPVAALIVCYFPVHTYIGINVSTAPPKDAIKLMSFNVKGMQGFKYKLAKDTNAIARYLYDEDCDIVCLQESFEPWLSDSCQRRLFEHYPYHQEDARIGNGTRLAIYTKYKILASDTLKYESKTNFSMYYLLKIGNEEVYVINNYLEISHLSREDRTQFSNMLQGNLDNNGVKLESTSVIGKLIESAVIRAPQAEAVANFVRQHKDRKIILMGDFNDNPISYTHYTIAKQLKDCFVSSGKGFGWTYCHNAMRVRIDNIMCSKSMVPYACKVDDTIDYSDHYPIECWVKMY